jgi:uncharacterized membrane protein
LLACFKITEETAVGMFHGKSFPESFAGIGGGSWMVVSFLSLVLFVVLVPFFGFTELRRVFGEGKLEKLFFTSRHPNDGSVP